MATLSDLLSFDRLLSNIETITLNIDQNIFICNTICKFFKFLIKPRFSKSITTECIESNNKNVLTEDEIKSKLQEEENLRLIEKALIKANKVRQHYEDKQKNKKAYNPASQAILKQNLDNSFAAGDRTVDNFLKSDMKLSNQYNIYENIDNYFKSNIQNLKEIRHANLEHFKNESNLKYLTFNSHKITNDNLTKSDKILKANKNGNFNKFSDLRSKFIKEENKKTNLSLDIFSRPRSKSCYTPAHVSAPFKTDPNIKTTKRSSHALDYKKIIKAYQPSKFSKISQIAFKKEGQINDEIDYKKDCYENKKETSPNKSINLKLVHSVSNLNIEFEKIKRNVCELSSKYLSDQNNRDHSIVNKYSNFNNYLSKPSNSKGTQINISAISNKDMPIILTNFNRVSGANFNSLELNNPSIILGSEEMGCKNKSNNINDDNLDKTYSYALNNSLRLPNDFQKICSKNQHLRRKLSKFVSSQKSEKKNILTSQHNFVEKLEFYNKSKYSEKTNHLYEKLNLLIQFNFLLHLHYKYNQSFLISKKYDQLFRDICIKKRFLEYSIENFDLFKMNHSTFLEECSKNSVMSDLKQLDGIHFKLKKSLNTFYWLPTSLFTREINCLSLINYDNISDLKEFINLFDMFQSLQFKNYLLDNIEAFLIQLIKKSEAELDRNFYTNFRAIHSLVFTNGLNFPVFINNFKANEK